MHSDHRAIVGIYATTFLAITVVGVVYILQLGHYDECSDVCADFGVESVTRDECVCQGYAPED